MSLVRIVPANAGPYVVAPRATVVRFITLRSTVARPGLADGLNVAFFLLAWNWIGDNITKLVQTFYSQGRFLPHPMGIVNFCTTL
ncbi:uncharacterized protein [Triticum aestivum]|uniref:uncharacterized protein isoform X3 n=1 Tax=Triticum aestivum TaxID=4565 RepID=UPI001D01A1BB|nr:uncharacterized protein LOC123112479 isoform X3 [Triticum aestivum]